MQSTQRMTRKGSKQLTDDARASQVASQIPPEEENQTIFKDPATLTEAGRKSQELFNTPERIKDIRDAQARRAKMTKEERDEDLEKTRLSMGLLLKDIMLEMRKRDKQRGKRNCPYISLYNEAAALAFQAPVPDPIEVGDGNDHDNNNSDDDLFSTDSNDENGDNDPNDDNNPDDQYSQSTDDEKKKKKKRSKRKPPQVPSGIPGMITGQA